MNTSSYISIDAPSFSWCGVFSLCHALINERDMIVQGGAETHLNRLFVIPLAMPISHSNTGYECLREIGYSEAEATKIRENALEVLKDFPDFKPTFECYDKAYISYCQTETEEKAALLVTNLRDYNTALIKAYLQQHVIAEMKKSWQASEISEEQQKALIVKSAEIIATLRETLYFLYVVKHDASSIQTRLAPLVYHLYKLLASLPENPRHLEEHRLIIAAILGSMTQANDFIKSVSSPINIATQNGSGGFRTYQEDLKYRFQSLYNHHISMEYPEITFPVPFEARSTVAMSEPKSIPGLDCENMCPHHNITELSSQMIYEMSRIFFKSTQLPLIQERSFDLLGSNERYVFKNEHHHLKLLIKETDLIDSARFSEENGFMIGRAPSGLSFCYQSIKPYLSTIAVFLGLLIGLYVLIQSFLKNKDISQAAIAPTPVSKPQAPDASSREELPEFRGVLGQRQPAVRFKPPIPKTLSKKERAAQP